MNHLFRFLFGAPQADTVFRHWARSKFLLPARYLDHLPLPEITIAEALKEQGYVTHFAGKWQLGGPGYWPEDQGFDINVAGCTKGALKNDLGEQHNLALEQPEKAAELHGKLKAWRAAVGARMPTANPERKAGGRETAGILAFTADD